MDEGGRRRPGGNSSACASGASAGVTGRRGSPPVEHTAGRRPRPAPVHRIPTSATRSRLRAGGRERRVGCSSAWRPTGESATRAVHSCPRQSPTARSRTRPALARDGEADGRCTRLETDRHQRTDGRSCGERRCAASPGTQAVQRPLPGTSVARFAVGTAPVREACARSRDVRGAGWALTLIEWRYRLPVHDCERRHVRQTERDTMPMAARVRLHSWPRTRQHSSEQTALTR